MRRAARFPALCALHFCLVSGWSAPGGAESSPEARAPSTEAFDLAATLELENLPSCVDERALEAKVGQLVRPERLNPARRVRGRVQTDGASWVVEFEVMEADVLVGRRRLTFALGACESFHEDTELVVAMLLEGHGFDPPAPAAETAAPEAPAAPERPKPPATPPDVPKPAERIKGHFRVGGELAHGIFPMASAGLRLEAGASFPFPLALLARATWHMDDALSIDGSSELAFAGYRLATFACYAYRRGWVLSGCAGLGFVSVQATGVGLPGARAAAFDTGTGVLGARFGIPVVRSWSVEIGAEVEMWFKRPEYVLSAEPAPRVLTTTSGVPIISWLSVGYDF
jgi:hypothetical protein